jgi:hypothetical protein
VYINGLFFVGLGDSHVYGDRPETYREHERSLWTLFQVMKNHAHTLHILNEAKEEVACLRSHEAFRDWVASVYPACAAQLDQPLYTKYPHPEDMRKG